MKRLPDQAELKELFDYDPDTGVVTRKKCTANRHVLGEVVGSKKLNGYLSVRVKEHQCLIHRLIWCWVYGSWPPNVIDHINRNRADNRLSNLRAVTRVENCHNSGLSKRNKSGHKGVHKLKSRWVAMICVESKTMYLGTFSTKEAASAAYGTAKKKFHPTAPQHV